VRSRKYFPEEFDIPVQYGDRRAGDPGTLIASSEKIKNLEYITNYDKLVEVHKENEEGYDLLRKYPNEFKLKYINLNLI